MTARNKQKLWRRVRRAGGRGVRRAWVFTDKRVWGTFELHRLISLFLVLAAPVVSFWASTVERPWLVGIVLFVQLALAAGMWVLGEGRARKLADERLDASIETQVALGDALDPVTAYLAKVACMPVAERRAQRSGLVHLILGAAVGLGPKATRPRACYFPLDKGTPRAMRHESSVGRDTQAKALFVADTEDGDAALKMVDERGFAYYDDVTEKAPPGWDAEQRGAYACFISVTVAAGPTAYGMLTLDACEPGALTLEDRQTLQVLGHLLGTAEVLTA